MADRSQHPGKVMEYKTRDRINSAVESWRRELAGQAGLTAEIRRELETHLADCISAFRQLGLSDEVCFRLARQRIGRPQKLDAEFEKVMNPATFWKRPMLIAAWAVFVVSFFLPSYTVMRGWQCALLQHTFWPQVLQGDLMAIHYELLTFANLLMLASPLFLAHLSNTVKQVQWLQHITLAATILVWSFALQLVIHQDAGGLKIGCLAWLLSFTLLYVAVVVQASEVRRSKVARHP